jgi:hypothetical protein
MLPSKWWISYSEFDAVFRDINEKRLIDVNLIIAFKLCNFRLENVMKFHI